MGRWVGKGSLREEQSDTGLDSANCSVYFGPKLDPSESVSLICELGIIMPAP